MKNTVIPRIRCESCQVSYPPSQGQCENRLCLTVIQRNSVINTQSAGMNLDMRDRVPKKVAVGVVG